MKLSHTLVAMMALSGLAVGCGSTEVEPVSEKISYEDGWWNQPGEVVQDHLAAVGMAKLLGNKANARSRAETDGIAKIAATLETKITQLKENWAKEVGDLAPGAEESITSLINDESFTRQYTDRKFSGAQVFKYHEEDGHVFALIVLRDPTTWVKNLVSDMSKRTLAEETLLKTQVMKDSMEEKMNALAEKEAAKIENYKSKWATPAKK